MANLEFELVVVGNPPLVFKTNEFPDHRTMLAGIEVRGFIDCVDAEGCEIRIYRHAIQAARKRPVITPARPAILMPGGRGH